jgi:hypothetical protein
MKHLFVVALTVASIVGSAAAVARVPGAGFAPHFSAGPRFVQPLPQMPESRIPAQLPAPAQAPTINGPVSQPHGPTNL